MNRLTLLGVDYVHLRLPDGGDLYLTPYGQAFMDHVHPQSWFTPEWFTRYRERLVGTSTAYRIRTRTVHGMARDLVVKWCRVGEQIPTDTFTFTRFVEAEFNSPYEEFALVMELRNSPGAPRIRTHKPLAIFVPPERLEPWQLGRLASRIERKQARYRDVELDICRQYILVYEWIRGVSIVEAVSQWPGGLERHWDTVQELAERGQRELAAKGFQVLDFKPEHMIVRVRPDGSLLRDRTGAVAYALVDFELLARTPQHEAEVGRARRQWYLQHQSARFAPDRSHGWPPHLQWMNILGVDYVYGHSESTGGELWVVGRDPSLFDYFLPERWRRTRRCRLSESNEVWYTQSKDQIRLVWKVSRVGEHPEVPEDHPRAAEILSHGYNSPFEEVAVALELMAAGIPTTYPRAIYMAGQTHLEGEPKGASHLDRRFTTHSVWRTPTGEPVLRPGHPYIVVWGYWNGSDETLAQRDEERCTPVSLLAAHRQGWIDDQVYQETLERAAARLAEAGWEDLGLEGGHLLLSRSPSGEFWREEDGHLEVRWCNFSLMRRRPDTECNPGRTPTDSTRLP